LGDLTQLADSIAKHGLIQPIVLDSDFHLVAGGRRLAAAVLLGWDMIEVTQLGDLTPRQLRILEIEENIRRKDLTQYERNKAMVDYVEAVKEELEEAEAELSSESDNNSARPEGRQPKVASQQKVAERTGIPQATISVAHKHVETVNAFPFMQSWPQYRVLEAQAWLKQLPEEEHPLISRILAQPAIPPRQAVDIITNLANKTSAERQEIYRLDSGNEQARGLALTRAANKPPMPDPRLTFIRDAYRSLQKAVSFCDDEGKLPYLAMIDRLKRLEEELKP